MIESFCPLRGEQCDDECEWWSESGACSAYIIANSMERIAQALEQIVFDPNEQF